MSLKPGLNIDLSFNRTQVKQVRAVIYDVDGKRIILSQTSPAIPSSRVGEPVHLSFISSKGDRVRRIGISAVVSGIIRNYELSSGATVHAVVLEQKTNPREINLRGHFRVRLHRDSGIDLIIDEKKYTLIDLSLMGLSFVQPLWQTAPKPADRIRLRLDLKGKSIHLTASVVRVCSTAKARSIAVTFSGLTGEMEGLLWKHIFAMDRQNISCRRNA